MATSSTTLPQTESSLGVMTTASDLPPMPPGYYHFHIAHFMLWVTLIYLLHCLMFGMISLNLALAYAVIIISITAYFGVQYLEIKAVPSSTQEHMPRKFSKIQGFVGNFLAALQVKVSPVQLSKGASAGASPLTRFTVFSKLPIDIRLMIWELVSHQPRVISIQQLFQTFAWDADFYISNNIPPAILQVNTESRAIGLKFYSLEKISQGQRKSYVNFEADIIFMAAPVQLNNLAEDTKSMDCLRSNDFVRKIKYLALRIDCLGYRSPGAHDPINERYPMVIDRMETLSLQLEYLILVDTTRAYDSQVVRYLIPLHQDDIVRHPLSRERWIQVKKYLEYIRIEIERVANNLKKAKHIENVQDWIEQSFPADIKFMQLRNIYKDGVESISLHHEDPLKDIHKPIYLGRLEKTGDRWEIVRC